MKRAFICYNSKDSKLVIEVCRYLKQNLDDIFYFEDNQRRIENNSSGILPQITQKIYEFEIFIAFLGTEVTEWQNLEIKTVIHFNADIKNKGKRKDIIPVLLGIEALPSETGFLSDYAWLSVQTGVEKDTIAYNLSKEIIKKLGIKWSSIDGLPPISNYFQYEKDIIKDYINLTVFGNNLFSSDIEIKDIITVYINLLGLKEKLGLDEKKFKNLFKRYITLAGIKEKLNLTEEEVKCIIGELTCKDSREDQLELSNEEIIEKVEIISKKIVEEIKKDLKEKLLNGLPPKWPKVKKMPDEDDTTYHNNTVNKEILGEFRSYDAKVLAAALTSFHSNSGICKYRDQLTFLEAGPREKLFYPREGENLKVAILIAGGIAPGINSVINGIVQRHELYATGSRNNYNVEIYGLQNGFYAFDAYHSNLIRLNSESTSKYANDSGSFIGTSRDDRLLPDSSYTKDQCQVIMEQLLNDDINILYVIGGDGSMKAAHALWNYSKEMIKEPRYRDHKISVIGIPKTMDNDILWVWQTFGFLSAVEKAREIIEQLSSEVTSNPRICLVQLFGSDSGFVVSHAVVASKSTICDVALIPEVHFTMRQLAEYIKEKIQYNRSKTRIPMSLVVMAETAIPDDALDYIENTKIGLSDDEKAAIKDFIEKKQLTSINKRNDYLRTAGLKIVSGMLKELLPQRNNRFISWERLRYFTNEPRHILRAIRPSCSDTIMGNRLGTLAVDNALAGYSDFMISQWLTEYVLVPLKLVVLGKKRIPTNGIFWKSVTNKTGQPDLNP